MWVPLMDTQQFFIKTPERSNITKYEQGGKNNLTIMNKMKKNYMPGPLKVPGSKF